MHLRINHVIITMCGGLGITVQKISKLSLTQIGLNKLVFNDSVILGIIAKFGF